MISIFFFHQYLLLRILSNLTPFLLFQILFLLFLHLLIFRTLLYLTQFILFHIIFLFFTTNSSESSYNVPNSIPFILYSFSPPPPTLQHPHTPSSISPLPYSNPLISLYQNRHVFNSTPPFYLLIFSNI